MRAISNVGEKLGGNKIVGDTILISGYAAGLGPAGSNCCTGGINCFFSNKSSGTVPNGPPSWTKGKTFEKTFRLVF